MTRPGFRRPPALDPAAARVAVILPVRNEAAHVAAAVHSVRAQTFDPARLEILVIDGNSSDGTAAILRGLTTRSGSHGSGDVPIRILSSPAGTIPTGMNVGIGATTADVIVRLDGHTLLEPDYVETCVRLLSETGAANAGGLMRPRGDGLVGEAMALALCSRFGIGDSRFHYSEDEDFVETVYMGAFRRTVLDEVGGYDEGVLANEDFELNHRIRAAGYGILLSPAIRSIYTPRDTLSAIARQFFRYGVWKSMVMRKHPGSIRLRHLVAPALVLSIAAGTCLGLTTHRPRWLMPLYLYGAAITVAAWTAAQPRRLALPLLGVFPSMHLSWGAGVLVGLLKLREPDASGGTR